MENIIIVEMTKEEYEEYHKYLNDKKEVNLQRQELQKFVDEHEIISDEEMIADEKSGHRLLKGRYKTIADPKNPGKTITIRLKEVEE